MHELLLQLSHPMTLGCVIVVLVLGVMLTVLMWISARKARAQLNAVYEAPEEGDDESPASALGGAAIRRLPDGRVLLADRADRLLDGWLQLHVLRLARFEAGGWITGVALFFTFFLIAWVLANDVGPAIAGSGKQSMLSLSHAVRTMGAKFVVSMVGIAMSILHGAVRARQLHTLHATVSRAARRLHTKTVSVQDYQLECTERNALGAEQLSEVALAIHRSVTHQHAENAARVEGLKLSIDRLQSIEVSVKDIGSELSKSLQQTVKKDIVEGIRRELQDIVDGMQKALAESFAQNLSATMTELVTALGKIERAVASQGHSQVETLLHQLSDAVSGGFASESARMKEALTRFAEVIPALDRQLREISQSTANDMAQRQAENSRTSELLLERVTAMLERGERQHQQAAAAAEQMQQLMLKNQNAVASSAATASEQFASRSRAALDELTAALQGATGNAAQVYGSLVAEVEQSARMLQQARSDTEDGAHKLAEASALLRTTLSQVAEVVTGLRQVGASISAGVQQARATVDGSAAVLKSSMDAVTHHQRFIEELSSRWPQLTHQYLSASDQAFTKIAGAWKEQADHIGAAVGKIGDSFSGSAAEFAEAVQDLGTQLDRLRGDKAVAGGR